MPPFLSPKLSVFDVISLKLMANQTPKITYNE